MDKPSHRVLGAALSLMVDQLTREVMTTLGRAGVESILLKGPSIADWLYQDGSVRSYGDCDLLVAPEQRATAESTLRGLGFEDAHAPLGHPRLETHGWARGPDHVDLHTTLIGIGAPERVVWDTLASNTEIQEVAGAPVRVLGHTALALHIVLHAAQHGNESPKPHEDLRRAIATLPRDRWPDVVALAETLRATDAFAIGLSLLPEGRDLAAWLELPPPRSTDASLRVDPVPLAQGFEQLAATHGVRARISLVAHELAPRPAFMRWWTPLARRGRPGLVAAYCWRPVWLVMKAGPGFMAWRRARRETGA